MISSPKRYIIHGLEVESCIELFPAKAIEHSKATAKSGPPADVLIQLGSVSSEGLSKHSVKRALSQVHKQNVWLNIPNIARYLISNGTTITIEPYAEADSASIRSYLLASAMAAILHQKEHLVLRASSVRIGDEVVIFAGEPNAGKSTIAAVFHHAGYDVLSDDIVAIDNKGYVMGGFPEIKLWGSTLDKLNIEKQTLKPVRTVIDKYSLPLLPISTQKKLPVKAVYLLHKPNESQTDQCKLEPLSGVKKFNALKQLTYQRIYTEGLGLAAKHLQNCTALANRSVINSMTLSAIESNTQQIVDLILDDMKNKNPYSALA